MSPKSPVSRFEHKPIRGMSSRMQLYCKLCKEFVAASDKPQILKIAENAHICPKLKTKR